MDTARPGPPDPLGRWLEPALTQDEADAQAAITEIQFRHHPGAKYPNEVWEGFPVEMVMLKSFGATREEVEVKVRATLRGHLVFIGKRPETKTADQKVED